MAGRHYGRGRAPRPSLLVCARRSMRARTRPAQRRWRTQDGRWRSWCPAARLGRPGWGHQTVCSKSYAKLIGVRGLTFHKRGYAKGCNADGGSTSFSCQNALSESALKATGLRKPLSREIHIDYWTRLNPTIMAGLSSEELMHANQNRTIPVFAVYDRGRERYPATAARRIC